MTDTSTHRCIDCPLHKHHLERELCPSCGRCETHCHQDNHPRMQRVPAAADLLGDEDA